MRIVIDLDEGLTVGVHIEGVIRPTQVQAYALRNLAILADEYRDDLLPISGVGATRARVIPTL